MEAQTRVSVDGLVSYCIVRVLPQRKSLIDATCVRPSCSQSDHRLPTDLDVSETANVISDNDMGLFTDVMKRGKKKAQKTKARIAPPAVAVVRKTAKSSAITGRGVGVGIEAIWAAS